MYSTLLQRIKTSPSWPFDLPFSISSVPDNWGVSVLFVCGRASSGNAMADGSRCTEYASRAGGHVAGCGRRPRCTHARRATSAQHPSGFPHPARLPYPHHTISTSPILASPASTRTRRRTCRLKYPSVETRKPRYSRPHLRRTVTVLPVRSWMNGRGLTG